MLLHFDANGAWDTPAETVIQRKKTVDSEEAGELYRDITGRSAAALRYCYTNPGFATGSNMVHYAVFVDPDEAVQYAEGNMWFNPYMLDKALASNSLSPILANELFRIHTMTMAWKTYDRSGRRLYPIRHYQPTFRLRDLSKWDIDYDDQTWFDVAGNNQDKPFYHIHKFFNRITGLFRNRSRQAQ